jgi:hypothetical protein
MLSHGVTQLSMPKIGCGLDKLQWSVGGRGGVRAMLLDLFTGVGVSLTVYELGTSHQQPARSGRQWSGRCTRMQEVPMLKCDEHRAKLQAQGMAAEVHRTSPQAVQGQRRTGGGKTSNRVKPQMQRRESQDEPPSPAPAPAAFDDGGVELRSPLEISSADCGQKCEQCESLATSGKVDTSVGQWFCDACWVGYEGDDVGGSLASSGPEADAIPIVTSDDARVERY